MTLIGNRYQIDTLLGRGGMGVVYRATDTRTGEMVAVKQLRREVAQRRPDMVERFRREAEALRQLNHPNIVKALDTLEHTDERYIVMEYVEGRTLHDILNDEGPLPVVRVAQIGIELADALTRAHYLEIIHRDLKPANVMIEPNGVPRLTDFGIAYLQNRDRVTTSRLQIGTPDYMSPEALEGKPVDARADIWALGIMMWEMLVGAHPWQASALPAMLNNIFSKPLPDLEALRPDTPVALVDLLYRMLEKDPHARIPSVRLVGAELEVILHALKHGSPETPSQVQLRSNQPRFETPTPSVELIRNNLGGQTTVFVGRESELGDLYRLVQEPGTRMVTMLGPGGMGKTRLMLELGTTIVEGRVPGTQARRSEPVFRDGVFLVALQAITSADAISNTVADAVGFQFYPGLPPKTQLLDYFRDKEILLLVDNCEHVLDGMPLFSDILHAAPNVKLVATSRAKLGLQGETLFIIDGMEYPTAGTVDEVMRYGSVQLFVQSARRVQPRFELKPEYVDAVTRICRDVRGMPLGIELAAGWAEMLSPMEIADEVARSLDFLESTENVPPRQRSVRAVFESSWSLLTPEERDAFAKIAVFRGSFTRAAATAVTGAGLRPTMGLVNKSFLQRDPDSGRYIAHELMRQFAKECLLDCGEYDRVHHAHMRHYLTSLIEMLQQIQGQEQEDAFSAIDWDFENIRAALLWAAQKNEAALLRDAVHPLGLYFDLRSLYTEGLNTFSTTANELRAHPPSPERDDALALLTCWAGFYSAYFRENEISQPFIEEAQSLVRPDSPAGVRAQTSMAAAYYHMLLGDVMLSRELYRQATDLFMQLHLYWDAAHMKMNWGTAYWYRTDAEQTDLDAARRLTLDALRLAQSIGESHLEAYCYMSLGRIDGVQHDYHAAAEHLYKALPLFRAARNVFAVGNTLHALAVNGVVRGRLDEARPLIHESVQLQRARGNRFGMAQSLLVEARLELWAGNWEASRELAVTTLEIANSINSLEHAHLARLAIARVDLIALEYDASLATLIEAMEIARATQRPHDLVMALHDISLSYFVGQDIDAAEATAAEALEIAESTGTASHIALAHFSVGRIAFFVKDTVRARQHFDAALAFLRDDSAQQTMYGWDDGYRYQTLYSVLADYAEMELIEGNIDAARATLREALTEASQWNNVPGQLDGLTFGMELLAAMNEVERAVELAVFIRGNPRAYAFTRSVASSFLRRIRQSGALPEFDAIVNRPSTLQLDDVVRELLNRL